MTNRGSAGIPAEGSSLLIVDPAMGMAGDMFSAALVGLGAPASVVKEAMQRAAHPIGGATVQVERVSSDDGPAVRLRIELETNTAPLPGADARRHLEAAIIEEHLTPSYADFARRALEILISAEHEVHSGGRLDAGELRIERIGTVRTPYTDNAPSQPQESAEGEFFVEVLPELAPGLVGLEEFSHIHLITYLHRSSGYSLRVTPPWQEDERPRTVGLFASRSPNRPSPLGVTLTEVRGIEAGRIHTGPLDLFDGTPVVDIKPHLRTLDETGVGNDGWLADSDHLLLHKAGVPHRHSKEDSVLHEAQDILLDIIGAAKGLEYLDVRLQNVVCLTPVSVGGGEIRFSHGVLPVPAPATAAILRRYRIPHVAGPVDLELLTPTGAALLAALQPTWRPREMAPVARRARHGMGLGTRDLVPLNALRCTLDLGPSR